MSKDIPIIFSRPMLRALLDGHKTQTRSILKPQLVCESHKPWPDSPEPVPSIDEDGVHCATCGAGIELDNRRESGVRGIPLRFAAGDRLWVREAVAWINNSEFGKPSYWEYRADTDGTCFPGDWPPECKDDPERPRWRPAIHMPRPASRITLIVTGVKVERLQDISNEDAIAEGVASWRNDWSVKEAATAFLQGSEVAAETKEGTVAQRLFYLVWAEINGRDSWAKNPFVTAITFRVIKANIDAPEARAA